jgi:hypothetical protein
MTVMDSWKLRPAHVAASALIGATTPFPHHKQTSSYSPHLIALFKNAAYSKFAANMRIRNVVIG